MYLNLGIKALEHRGILEYVRNDHKSATETSPTI